MPIDLNRADRNSNLDEIRAAIDAQLTYKPPTHEQGMAFSAVTEALKLAYLAIVRNAPPCADRTVALRKIREARADANSAIAHEGRY